MSAALAAEWQPGDPLYTQGSYTNYLFNFREESVGEHCMCPDAASWPTPAKRSDHLDAADELGDFIAEYRRWEAMQP